MKLSLKLLAAAMAFAAAGQASAAISNGLSGNGELFLSVYDPVALVSYTRDLGVTMDDFIANGSTAGYSLSYTADATLMGAFGAFAGNSNLKWNVAALDSVNPHRYLSTTNDGLAKVKTQTTSNLTGFGLVNGYVDAVNNNSGDVDPLTNNSSVWTSASGSSYFGNGFMDNWRAKAVFNSTAAVGSSLEFFLLTPGSSSLAKANVSQFASADGNATWTMATDGTLTYSVPAPAASAVPVPAAAWLLGSGLIGLVGVARRKS